MKFKVFLCCFFVIIIFSSVYTETEMYEGDKCTTKDNEPGIFKDVEDCKDYFMMMRNKYGSNVVNHLVRCQQKPDKHFIFCCKSDPQPTATQQPTTQQPTTQQPTTQQPTTQQPTTQQPTTQKPTTQQPTTQPDIISKTNSRSELACQKYQRIEEKFSTKLKMCHGNNIFGGENADINEFPHMAAIGYEKDTNLLDYDFDCGGSLISEKFVLTAVHCVNKRNRVPKIVRLGKTSLDNTKKDCLHAVDVNIVSKTLHSNYGHESKHSDIALLELERSVEQQFARSLLPACLHNGFELLNNLTISGWGFMLNEKNEKIRKGWLQKAENMNEISLNSCKELFEEALTEIVETQICITNNKSADACTGDSGGPLSYKNDKLHYIAGVVSYGASCGGSLPGIYTRVSSYIEWIEDIVWPQT